MRSFANTYYAKSNFCILFFCFPRRGSASVCDLCARIGSSKFLVVHANVATQPNRTILEFLILFTYFLFTFFFLSTKAWRRTWSILNMVETFLVDWCTMRRTYAWFTILSFLFRAWKIQSSLTLCRQQHQCDKLRLNVLVVRSNHGTTNIKEFSHLVELKGRRKMPN